MWPSPLSITVINGSMEQETQKYLQRKDVNTIMSPGTNIHDAYLFPAFSKMLSRSQTINFSAKTLDIEELWLLGKKIFASILWRNY